MGGLPEKRAFYLDEAKFVKMLLRVIFLGFTGIAFLVSALGFGIYIIVQIANTRRNPQPPAIAHHA